MWDQCTRLAMGPMMEDLDDHVPGQVSNLVRRQGLDQVMTRVSYSVKDKVQDQFRLRIYNQIVNQIVTPIKSQVWIHIQTTINDP
jgi:hypothetical protein